MQPSHPLVESNGRVQPPQERTGWSPRPRVPVGLPGPERQALPLQPGPAGMVDFPQALSASPAAVAGELRKGPGRIRGFLTTDTFQVILLARPRKEKDHFVRRKAHEQAHAEKPGE